MHLGNLPRLILSVAAVCALVPGPVHAGKAEHVVIVVMDGLRRDSVTAADMPTLTELGKSGVFFNAHHPVFVSSTEVNGTALATGMAPQHSGVMGNREYRPDIELLQPVDTQDPWASWRGDKLHTDGWVHAATLPQLARAAGLKTAVAGTKGVALLWDRDLKKRTPESSIVFEGKAIPSATLDRIFPDFGPMPFKPDWKYADNHAQDRWTTRVLTEKLWAKGVPPLSVLWLSEPDFSQHGTSPGSDQSKAALRSSDRRLATMLQALEKKHLREKTDVIVVSDHGFSSISRNVDVADDLRKHGFRAETAYTKPPEKGNILVVGLGGSVLCYVIGHDEDVTDRLVSYLQTTDWAGVIFSHGGEAGTFKFSDVGIDTPTSPDVMVAMRWRDELGDHGMPGTIVAEGGMGKGMGMHGSLSRYDLKNTLIAAGPDFKKEFVNDLPSANSDVAPTVAHILGIPVKEPMDGRVLYEALDEPNAAPAATPQTITLRARAKVEDKTWKQYVRITTYLSRRYYDEGNRGDLWQP